MAHSFNRVGNALRVGKHAGECCPRGPLGTRLNEPMPTARYSVVSWISPAVTSSVRELKHVSDATSVGVTPTARRRRCRPEQATVNDAGTSVANCPLDRRHDVCIVPPQLRCSGNGFGDLVPAYVRNAG